MDNVDTDQIIPARFLKTTEREGFGANLFYDWRYDGSGVLKTDFVLNSGVYSGKILITGSNFGCGSSREHAAWAISDYGFRVVISSFFADIFRNNALNNGLLPVQVSSGFLKELFDSTIASPQNEVTVNLPLQTVANSLTGHSETFEINAFKKECLIDGLDDIDRLLANMKKIEEYEKTLIPL
jgi:3-isopropylmalate/(R)-2-methylmalate dehydratase small subunit